MSTARSLTGGTNDVNPQPLRVVVTPSTMTAGAATYGANQATTVALPIPVQRLSTGGRAQVMEILSFDWDIIISGGSAETLDGHYYRICLSSRSNSTTSPSMGSADPYTIALVAGSQSLPASSKHALSGFRQLNDGAGHGVLFGMDTLYVQFSGALHATTSTPTGNASLNVCIWYRWKNVGFSEYVGMVTSS